MAMRAAARLALSLTLLAPAGALALDNDPALRGFGRFTRGVGGSPGTLVVDQAGFDSYVRELGMAMAPTLLGPAETLGLNGFMFSIVEYSATNVDEGADYWTRATEGTLQASEAFEADPEGAAEPEPPSFLHTFHVRMRKGLPYSFEVGASVSYLLDSELWAFGGELKWSPNESVPELPVDFGLRVAANRTLGSVDLDLTTLTTDLVLSRGAGLGGVVNLTPYMAYSPLFIYARSNVVDATPGFDESTDVNDVNSAFVLDRADPVVHRFVLGARLVGSVVSFTPEVALAKGVQTYNLSFGLEF
ncbi:MAG: hypothetical protein ACOYM9_01890 [Bradymonadia bacterium]|jgi:hypothetical protein